jgi:hypothetical protein
MRRYTRFRHRSPGRRLAPSPEATRRHLAIIPENLARVLALAKSDGVDPAQAADALARAAVP